MAAYQKKSFRSITGESLVYHLYQPRKQPVGVVQLTHGMAEHISRYDELACTLAEEGFAIIMHNHLGHGESASVRGFFAKKRGWDALLSDMHTLRKEAEKEFYGLPYFLMGHSMGSFLLRCYLTEYGSGLRGAVLSGTGAFGTAEVQSGLFLSRILMLLGLGRRPSKLIDTLAFSSNNKPFQPSKTPYDWLSRDQEKVSAYANDPLCGFLFTASGYHDLFTGLKRLNRPDALALDKNLAVLFLSGSRDPVGKNGTGMKKVADSMKNAGISDITVKLYDNARHEVFNETNRREVYEDLIRWLLDKCQA